MHKFYAGIGSRETPPTLIPIIDDIVIVLNKLNYTLRSGGAIGADSFFENKAKLKEIYLPQDNYNFNNSTLHKELSNEIIEQSYDIASKFHPNQNYLKPPVKKLISRNTFQVLGKDLQTPSEFIICFTVDGKFTGGTSQSLRIAKYYNIPIYNLYFNDSISKLKKYLHLNTNSIF